MSGITGTAERKTNTATACYQQSDVFFSKRGDQSNMIYIIGFVLVLAVLQLWSDYPKDRRKQFMSEMDRSERKR